MPAGPPPGMLFIGVSTGASFINHLFPVWAGLMGLGNDRPGSPVSDAVRFPEHGLVFGLNYRGARPFLSQAAAQAPERDLQVADGWICFLLGWAHVIALVFDVRLDGALLGRLEAAAEQLRARRGAGHG